MLIAYCVEDCHRFACGQTDLFNTIATNSPNTGNTSVPSVAEQCTNPHRIIAMGNTGNII